MKAQRISRGIGILFLYPWHQMAVGGQCHALAALRGEERPST